MDSSAVSILQTSDPESTEANTAAEHLVQSVCTGATTLAQLVTSLGTELTCEDHHRRLQATRILAECVERGSAQLTAKDLHHLSIFFTDRLSDWQCLDPALQGCTALLARRANLGLHPLDGHDGVEVVKGFLANVRVQSLTQASRYLCLLFWRVALQGYGMAAALAGVDLVEGTVSTVDEEKDPRCLLVAFECVKVCVQIYQTPGAPQDHMTLGAAELFDVVCCYFPISFTPPKKEGFPAITREDLKGSLEEALTCSPRFSEWGVPLLLEKLSSVIRQAKLDSLSLLVQCCRGYGLGEMRPHLPAIWLALKSEILSPALVEPTPGHKEDLEKKKELAAAACEALKGCIIHLGEGTLDTEALTDPLVEDVCRYLGLGDRSEKEGAQRHELNEGAARRLISGGMAITALYRSAPEVCTRVFTEILSPLLHHVVSSFPSQSHPLTYLSDACGVMFLGHLVLEASHQGQGRGPQDEQLVDKLVPLVTAASEACSFIGEADDELEGVSSLRRQCHVWSAVLWDDILAGQQDAVLVNTGVRQLLADVLSPTSATPVSMTFQWGQESSLQSQASAALTHVVESQWELLDQDIVSTGLLGSLTSELSRTPAAGSPSPPAMTLVARLSHTSEKFSTQCLTWMHPLVLEGLATSRRGQGMPSWLQLIDFLSTQVLCNVQNQVPHSDSQRLSIIVQEVLDHWARCCPAAKASLPPQDTLQLVDSLMTAEAVDGLAYERSGEGDRYQPGAQSTGGDGPGATGMDMTIHVATHFAQYIAAVLRLSYPEHQQKPAQTAWQWILHAQAVMCKHGKEATPQTPVEVEMVLADSQGPTSTVIGQGMEAVAGSVMVDCQPGQPIPASVDHVVPPAGVALAQEACQPDVLVAGLPIACGAIMVLRGTVLDDEALTSLVQALTALTAVNPISSITVSWTAAALGAVLNKIPVRGQAEPLVQQAISVLTRQVDMASFKHVVDAWQWNQHLQHLLYRLHGLCHVCRCLVKCNSGAIPEALEWVVGVGAELVSLAMELQEGTTGPAGGLDAQVGAHDPSHRLGPADSLAVAAYQCTEVFDLLSEETTSRCYCLSTAGPEGKPGSSQEGAATCLPSLGKSCHLRTSILWCQRSFTLALEVVKRCGEGTGKKKPLRVVRLMALAQLLRGTPPACYKVDPDAITPLVMEALRDLPGYPWPPGVQPADGVKALLGVLAEFVMDPKLRSRLEEYIADLMEGLLALGRSPLGPEVREVALQCLVAVMELPYHYLHPYRGRVLKMLNGALDDDKRAVRMKAIRCKRVWSGK